MGIGAEGRKKKRGDRLATQRPVEGAAPLREAVEAVRAPNGPALDAEGASGVLKDHVFDLDYTDGRGRVWQGRFKSHAVTYKERIDIGLIRSRMTGGVAPHLLDINTSNMLEMLAHLAVALDDGPDWANDLEALHDPAVVIAIYREVLNHEERFHGTRPSDTGSPDDGEPDAGDGASGTAEDG